MMKSKYIILSIKRLDHVRLRRETSSFFSNLYLYWTPSNNSAGSAVAATLHRARSSRYRQNHLGLWSKIPQLPSDSTPPNYGGGNQFRLSVWGLSITGNVLVIQH